MNIVTTKTFFKTSTDEDVNVLIDRIMILESEDPFIKGFYPIDKPEPANHKTVVFPSISKDIYQKSLKYVEKIKNLYPNIEDKPETKLLRKLLKETVINDKRGVTNEDFNRIKSSWEKIETWFYSSLFEMFPVSGNSLEVTIHITPYGTYSYNSLLKKKNNHLFCEIWVRNDMGVNEIADSLIASIFRKDFKDNFTWAESEAIIDFILSKSKIKSILPDFKGTLEISRNKLDTDKKLLLSSKEFLKSIGYNHSEKLNYSGNMIYIDGQIPEYHFTPTETQILKLLLDKKGQVCSYFDISSVTWDDPEDFSIWAISRMIYKIRNKLKQNGIDPEILKTYRGKGFILTTEPW